MNIFLFVIQVYGMQKRCQVLVTEVIHRLWVYKRFLLFSLL
ncbi:hypothetical protein SAMN05443144_107156 [Fodinibius roseus]|uniref:Uncharacterized protein n=1 Tax=Fodinibius roseus TaxID=1194090 RepID=A0A1M5AS20_9BACT|nr:hypothetical protein SAMN05443144_107156 [Fodinibius roseus]